MQVSLFAQEYFPEGTRWKGSAVEVAFDGVNYFLNLKTHEAIIIPGNNCSGELDISSEVNYNDETFVVKGIFVHSFYENTELTKVRIPKTIETIEHTYPWDPDDENPPTGMIDPIYMNPFRGCSALESIEVDEENSSFKSVDGVLFSQDGVWHYYYKTNSYSGTALFCYPEGAKQESYSIPEGVEWIGGNAFYHNLHLSSLTLPNSMNYICDEAFYGCSTLRDVYCHAENVPITEGYAFEDTPIASATLHVPAGSIEEYKATSPWSGFGNIVALPIEINETTFPDENFRNWVLANSFGRDGVLTDAEIASVTKLNIGSRRIQSLKGIEFFTELSWLDVTGNSGITEIDLSPFPKMKYLDVGWCKIKELDLSKNTELSYLDCRGNGLTALDLSKNTSLTTLICFGNQLTELDLSKNTLLTEIECSNNLLEELDVSKNMNLEKLTCIENQLSALDVSRHTALKYLTCYNNLLNSLDVSGCVAIISLNCNSNQLLELDLTDCTELFTLYCTNNQLNELDLSTNTRLDQLYCQHNNLTKLNVSNNKEIRCLVCNDNLLTELDVSGVTKLYHLHCYRNQLTSLNMSGNPSLINLYCYSNQIKGEAMDALLESMHTIGEGDIYGFRVINSEDEQNVMTKAQVAVAKAKGWTPLHHVGGYSWQEYEGSDDGTSIGEIKNEQITIKNAGYDLQGCKIAKPQKGINIIRYSDGTTRKVLVK